MQNKINLMRNSVLVLISALFLSCEDPTDIGFTNLEGNNSITYFSDTLSVASSTFLMDSAITSAQSAVLVGSYTDPIFGKIQASAYLQPTLPDGYFTGEVDTFNISSTAVYDSLAIRLINKELLFYGDTLGNITLNVFRLRNSLETTANYNYNQEIPYDTEPIATITVDRSDFENMDGDSLTAGDSLYIDLKIPDSIGEELFALANTTAANEKENFINAFPGFVIKASSDSEMLVPLTLGTAGTGSTELVLFYHETGSTTTLGYPFEFSAGRYTHFSSEKGNTALASLSQPSISLPSQETGGRTYVQAGTSIATKLTFPGLTGLNNPQVTNATLEFSADTTTFSENTKNAPYITFLELESNGNVKRENNQYQYLSPYTNPTVGMLSVYNDSTNLFVADITNYIQDVTAKKTNDDGIGLVVGFPATTTSSFVFTAGLNSIVLKDFKLKLYYSE